MRMIDADELLLSFAEDFMYRNSPYFNLSEIKTKIDNTLTVANVTFDEDKFAEERLQGKWIECTKSGMPLTEYGRMTGEKWYGFKCSQCKFIYKGNALVESPFCQKCGADMRGDKE